MSATRQYDGFGNATSTTVSPSAPFGFAGAWGYQQDPDSGLMLLGHRYYDPSTGRFLTRDPAKDGRNWFGYCGNNALSGVDPTGLCSIGWLDNIWVNGSEWWSGTDVIGPHGEAVRIGGWHSFFFNGSGNAMTVNGTVHLNDYDDYANYVNSDRWSRHEIRHTAQVDEGFGGNSISFIMCSIIGYLFAFGHDGAPLEIDAENAAGRREEDMWGRGLWPLFKALATIYDGGGGGGGAGSSGNNSFPGGIPSVFRKGGAMVYE